MASPAICFALLLDLFVVCRSPKDHFHLSLSHSLFLRFQSTLLLVSVLVCRPELVICYFIYLPLYLAGSPMSIRQRT